MEITINYILKQQLSSSSYYSIIRIISLFLLLILIITAKATMSREKHVRKLIEITIQEFAARTFSTSLGTQHAKLLSLCPIDGVKFS